MSIALEGVRVAFGDTRALDDVSLEVVRGAVTAVIGGDGAGKTTLLKLFTRRVAPERGTVDTLERTRIGYQPATSGVWPAMSVAENVEFVGESYGMRRADLRARGAALLERAGLTAARDRLGRDLSGGMRQKLGFVLAVLHSPECLLLDEPSTGVDPVSRVELWRLVTQAAADGVAVLIATTYLDEAERASAVLALDAGHTLAQGTAATIVAGLPGTVARVDAAAEPRDAWRRGTAAHAWFPRGTAGPTSAPPKTPHLADANIALTLDRAVPQSGPGAGGAPTMPATLETAAPETTGAAARRAPSGEDELVHASGVTKRFGSHTAVHDMRLDVRRGEIVGLIGANGAGKTTFLRTLLGLEAADEGDIRVFGSAPAAASRRRLGYVPQGLGLYATMSVAENLSFVCDVYGAPRPPLPPALTGLQNALVGRIGLGLQRQLAFTLALAHDPELLVLDEPTSGVDPLARARLWDTIRAEAQRGVGVLVTTHYLQEAEQCDRLALMAAGELIGEGRSADLTAGERAVLVAAPRWQDAFVALDRARLPVMLSGTDVRVAGVDPGAVRDVLDAAGVLADVRAVPPTLEETMVLRGRAESA